MHKKELTVEIGEKLEIASFLVSLEKLGYERAEGAPNSGQYKVLGGDIIVFVVSEALATRFEFFGAEVESISRVDDKGKKIEARSSQRISTNLLILSDKTRIRPGDYVVHEDHGVGLFSRFEVKKVEKKEILYIVILYLNNDCLFVPYDLLIKISSYIGIGRRRPKLSRLGSQTWQKTYKKTYDNIIIMARELLQLYAQREIVKREPFKIDQKWHREIIKTFGYTDTTDQTEATKQVFQDMEKDIPMDRLICGDVGFGKTEIAIRAAAQTCANSHQVAILVPTTILCEQHYETLKRRFANLPVRIEHLSRLVGGEQQTEILKGLASGAVDIVIGTHKLFSQQVKFKNLGLMVVDEEQKFGVKDKEKLKQLRSSLNVLTLTATPIPRTLFMGLSGIRDISQLSLAPKGRKEIETKIARFDPKLIEEYVNREIDRGGQIYYLHNEVRTIGGKKNKLMRMFPKLSIEVAHGQLSEKMLGRTMGDFAAGKIDLLVCSTIVENGLDLPNANTLIVEDSDNFGLSQLYQIRGRIGRSPRQSYALFTVNEKRISSNAEKRLRALADNTELGTGYNIALSDLEIRGGGNILGKEQHGNMEAIGLVLYTRMLNKAVGDLKKSGLRA